MLCDKELHKKIQLKIAELEVAYQNCQGLILTEDDLKCYLYKKLLEIDELSQNYPTADSHILSIPVHTELSWYDHNNSLRIIPDITILNPNKLSILHKLGKQNNLPRKEYSFSGEAILFELKFIKNKTGITIKTYNSKIKSDIDKINRLSDRLRNQGYGYKVFCYFIIFNKTDITYNNFKRHIEQQNSDKYNVIYCIGNVKFK